MNDVAAFLATCPVLSDMTTSDIDELASLCQCASYTAGTILLNQGGHSDAIYFLRKGRLALRMQRGLERQTIAMLAPPQVFGELSFLTGKPCVADVEVAVDSDVIYIPREAMPQAGPMRDALVRGLWGEIAAELQLSLERDVTAPEPPVVLIRNYPAWAAPRAFAAELANSLTLQTGTSTVVLNIGVGSSGLLVTTGEKTAVLQVGGDFGRLGVRASVARQLDEVTGFHNILLNVIGPESEAIADQLQDLANFRGHLLGPGDPLPQIQPDEKLPDFIVQSADQPTLAILSGGRQLIREAPESEASFLAGKPVTPPFRRTVDSIARFIAGTQVGLALGGGAAWGWAHIGVLKVLEQAGLPIDLIAGCSMGSVIGSLYATGCSTARLAEIAEYWRTRTRRFLEWRLWRMCLVSERAVRKAFGDYFGAKTVNETDIPFWANAVDIEAGEEYAIREGTLVDCVRSSIALPGLLPPHSLPPRLLVDAGIMNPVPAALLREMGSHYSIAVNAMAAPGTTAINMRYPMNAFHVMTKCMFVMGHEIGERAEHVANIVFTPDLSGMSLLQFQRGQEMIERGRLATEARLPAILAGYQTHKNSVRT
jgi:NTE family protein